MFHDFIYDNEWHPAGIEGIKVTDGMFLGEYNGVSVYYNDRRFTLFKTSETGVLLRSYFYLTTLMFYQKISKEGFPEWFSGILDIAVAKLWHIFDVPLLIDLYADGEFPSKKEITEVYPEGYCLDNYEFRRAQRNLFIELYGFVPFSKETEVQLVNILKGKKVCEVGAGKGLLSKKLFDNDISIIAVDNCEGNYSSRWWADELPEWFLKASVDDIEIDPYDAIISVWAPLGSPMLTNVAKRMHAGQLLFCQGEYRGCTADDDFFQLVDEEFEEDEELTKLLRQGNVSFEGIHDDWYVYRKL